MPTAVEVSEPRQLPGRIVHVHIPTMAGAALSAVFQQAFRGRIRVYPARYGENFKPAECPGDDFFTGHLGFKVASEIGGDPITVPRDPIDRSLSEYLFQTAIFVGRSDQRQNHARSRHDMTIDGGD